MPIKCVQQLHLWGSIQHCYGAVWGPLESRHESRAVMLTLNLISCAGLSLGAAHPALHRGGSPKSFSFAAQGRQLGLCLAAWLGASEPNGLCWSPMQGRVLEKGWGCGSLSRARWCARHQPRLQPLVWAGASGTVPGTLAQDSRSFPKLPDWQGSALQPPRLLLSWLCALLGGWWLSWPTGTVLGQEREEERDESVL